MIRRYLHRHPGRFIRSGIAAARAAQVVRLQFVVVLLTAAVQPELFAQSSTAWATFLQSPTRAEALQTADSLASVRSALLRSRIAEVRRLAAGKEAVSTGSLADITGLPLPTKVGGAGATHTDAVALRAELGRYLRGDVPLGSFVPAGGLRPDSTLAEAETSLDELLARRDAEIRRAAPDPGTSDYSGLEKALQDWLADRGLDGGTVASLAARVDALAGNAVNVAAIRAYVTANGPAISRQPANDDLAGWRFLFAQTLGQEWIGVLAAPTFADLADRMKNLSEGLSEISPAVASDLSSNADAIDADSRSVAAISSYLGDLWLSLSIPSVVSQIEHANVSLNERKFVLDTVGVSQARLRWFAATEPLVASAAADFLTIVSTFDGPLRSAYLAGLGVNDDVMRDVASKLSSARIAAETQIAGPLGLTAIAGAPASAGAASASPAQSATGLSGAAPSGGTPPGAAPAPWEGAVSIVSQAAQYVQNGTSDTDLHWTLLSILENRYAAHLVETDLAYSTVEKAYSAYLKSVYADVDRQAISILTDMTPENVQSASGQGNGTVLNTSVRAEEVYRDPVQGREVSFYHEAEYSNGTVVRTAVPVSTAWEAYARAFYAVTHAANEPLPSGVSTTELDRWARLHGQAVLPFRFKAALPDVDLLSPAEVDRRLSGNAAGPAPIAVPGAATLLEYLDAVIGPWAEASTSAGPGAGTDVSGTETASVPTFSMRMMDRGMVFFYHHLVADVVSRYRSLGDDWADVDDPRLWWTLKELSLLTDFNLAPSDVTTSVASIWSDVPVPEARNGSAVRLTRGVASTLLDQYRYRFLAALALRYHSLETFMETSPSEPALQYGARAYRRVLALARLGFMSPDAFADARDRISRAIRLKAPDARSRAAVAAALFDEGLISRDEYSALAPGGARK